VRSQLAGVINPQGKVVDPARLAHSIHKHLKRQGECVGLLPEAVYPRLVRVVVDDVNDEVLVVDDGPRPHSLQVHVEQESRPGLHKAAYVSNRQVLVLRAEAHRAPRQLLQVDLHQAVRETGPGADLQGSQHGRVMHMESKVKH
jgi:hypothetical protein